MQNNGRRITPCEGSLVLCTVLTNSRFKTENVRKKDDFKSHCFILRSIVTSLDFLPLWVICVLLTLRLLLDVPSISRASYQRLLLDSTSNDGKAKTMSPGDRGVYGVGAVYIAIVATRHRVKGSGRALL